MTARDDYPMRHPNSLSRERAEMWDEIDSRRDQAERLIRKIEEVAGERDAAEADADQLAVLLLTLAGHDASPTPSAPSPLEVTLARRTLNLHAEAVAKRGKR